MKFIKTLIAIFTLVILFSCEPIAKENKIDVAQILEKAEKQTALLLKSSETAGRIPRTVTAEGNMHWTNKNFDWTEGFFPGTCWYLFEHTNDTIWKNAADKYQNKFEGHKNRTDNHDLGFVFNSSYGNGYRLTKNEAFKDVMLTASNSLITRFNPAVGCIQSWDVEYGWQSKRNWQFPVIIDNMMNLELLFEVSELTGDTTYKDIAISHANTTMKNHFREDYSSYHVVDYDLITGEVRAKQTAQGFADNSSWARGQAWAVYGYTVCYRYTKDVKYLELAEHIANYIINYKETPKDGIPYWDYNAQNIPNEPRDASAAAITVSALIELNEYSKQDYQNSIDKILSSLASKEYTAELGTNHNFILKHSVGSIPHNNEIDVPLNYADYYYVEALLRYKSFLSKN
ncbi:glycoside hydrolase family 88 protein [Polaribacter sp. IC073]|uniref:glycoside hydrolase family 88 protein n=1 Tax=Polaribacter sp. IC073 TaxID=2508540 RepID=UPI0011BE6D6B|nr:glycoside hydrolase family 88 protein [Polaribacter sp. IC073]TXD47945.1 glucuronyl hydrolase [Polaribacter sp. IC073]